MMRLVFGLFALAAVSLLAEAPPAGTTPAQPAPSDPSVIFRSDVSLVRVDAQVVDLDNHPITGLRAEDFILREGGKQQEIRNFVSEKMPVDVILLLDVSRSMRPHVERVASAADRALGVLGDQDRVAILVFDRATRVRLPFRNSRREAERELQLVLDQENFRGGTDIKRGLLYAADYMARHARTDARRAIVILTDDQTERDRDDAGVLGALTRADAVLSALIAPDALHTGSTRPHGAWPDAGLLGERLDDIIPPELWPLFNGAVPLTVGPHTRSAGTSDVARQSGGDSMAVEDASALETTLSRIRERYGLYFYLPDGVKPGDERAIQVELSEAARRRYPGADVRYRRSYMAPNMTEDSQNKPPILVGLPLGDAPDGRSLHMADTNRSVGYAGKLLRAPLPFEGSQLAARQGLRARKYRVAGRVPCSRI